VADILSEQTLRIHEAAAIARVSFATAWRWILKGAPAPDGTRVRLEAIRCGAKWLTSQEALRRFSEALTPRLNTEPAPAPRTPTARQRASERAAKRLSQIGI
jgi:hypothetical protein